MSAKSMAALWLAVADSKCLRYTAKAEDLRLLLAELALLRAEHEAYGAVAPGVGEEPWRAHETAWRAAEDRYRDGEPVER